MDRTPKIPKFINKRNDFSTGNGIDQSDTEMRLCSTPVLDRKMIIDTENDDSPVHIACTQEGCENVDVVWDWNSPQAKQKPKRKQKRLLLSQSPKNPLKRHSSNNQIQNFEKLRDELQSLREAMAVPDNEESLLLSPVEEADYKHVNDEQNLNDLPVPPFSQEILEGNDNLFDDSVDEVLLLCTQKIEADLEMFGKNMNGCNITKLLNNNTTITNSNKNGNTGIDKLPTQSVANFKNSERQNEQSFDNALRKINVEHLEVTNSDRNMAKIKITHLGFPRTRSENEYINTRQVGKVEFYRTQSFESTMECTQVIPIYKLEEIERKRKEALAKLESKRKQEHSDSPSKCSPDEIEQKRLKALAKLEAKRQQDIIERKRQEALKRLEQNRKKNAVIVKSSLTKRL